MKFVMLFFVVYIIQGIIIPSTEGIFQLSMFNNALFRNQLGNIRPAQSIGANMGNGLKQYIRPNQISNYNQPQFTYTQSQRESPMNNKLYENIGKRDAASNPNSWIETENSDYDSGSKESAGLGIFNTGSQLTNQANSFINDNLDNRNGLKVTTEGNMINNLQLPKYVVTTPSNEIGTINSGSNPGGRKIGDHYKPKKDVLMVLISKKVEYQAKAVVPENERNNPYKIVYYTKKI